MARPTRLLSTTHLASLDAAMRAHVRRGDVSGMVTLVGRGEEVHLTAHGVMDLASRAPMRRDSLVRIASMTKPVTAVAALMLVEDGTLALDEAVDGFLPELADRRVLRTPASPLDDTVPAERPLTLRDLLTLRAGLGIVMAFPPRYPIQAAMAEAGVEPGPAVFAASPDEFLARLGRLPLLHQPGAAWMYDTGLDLAGVLIARASGRGLGGFMAERIFAPLGMDDTAFFVPEAKLGRLATAYARDAGGAFTVWDPTRGGRWAAPPPFESGAGGLVSTADDFARFARMLLAGGEHGGRRLLAPDSVALMTTDHLTPRQRAASTLSRGILEEGRGWGLGVAIDTDGSFGWDGGYGTTFAVDPRRGSVAILLAQRLLEGPADFALHEAFLALAREAVPEGGGAPPRGGRRPHPG